MKHAGENILRSVIVTFLAMTALINVVAAQSDDETITVKVMYECESDSVMGVQANASDGPDYPIIVPDGGTESNNPWVNFMLTVQSALCNQWDITAELTDFKLTTSPATTFPASTFVLTKNTSIPPNPKPWIPQPDWVEALPSNLPIGVPTIPDSVTFIESSSAGTATSSVPLMSASTAEYGSPGSVSAYFRMKLTGVPADQAPGDYTSTITVTMQGED